MKKIQQLRWAQGYSGGKVSVNHTQLMNAFFAMHPEIEESGSHFIFYVENKKVFYRVPED